MAPVRVWAGATMNGAHAMTSHGRAVIVLIAGFVAAAVGIYCWIVPDAVGWRVAGTVLFAVAVASWVLGGRLFGRAERAQTADPDSGSDDPPAHQEP